MKDENKEPNNAATLNPLGTEKVWKLMARFGIPAIISLLVNAAYNLIDQVLIGNSIGMLGIAATNIAFPLTTIMAAVSLLLGVGGASNFNLRLGEGNKEAADRFAGSMLGLLAISGTVIGVLALIFIKPLVFAFGATETVQPLALSYTAIVSVGIPFGIFTTGACTLIRADGSPRYSMLCTLVGAVFNLIVDPILLFVLHFGIRAIAWSTTIGQMMTAGIAMFYLMRRTKTVTLKKEYLLPRLSLSIKICALGIASCTNQLAMAAVQITLNNTLRHYGALSIYGSDIPLGSVGAISKLNIMFLAITVGIAQGCQPIHGFNYGAKKYARVKQALRLALLAATAASVAVFIVFQVFPEQLMIIFGENDPLYIEFATRYLRIYMLMTFVNGIQPVTASFFNSIGKAARGMWISLTRQIIFLLPLLLILPVFFGMDGVFFSGPIADLTAAVMAAYMIVSEYKSITVLQADSARLND